MKNKKPPRPESEVIYEREEGYIEKKYPKLYKVLEEMFIILFSISVVGLFIIIYILEFL